MSETSREDLDRHPLRCEADVAAGGGKTQTVATTTASRSPMSEPNTGASGMVLPHFPMSRSGSLSTSSGGRERGQFHFGSTPGMTPPRTTPPHATPPTDATSPLPPPCRTTGVHSSSTLHHTNADSPLHGRNHARSDSDDAANPKAARNASIIGGGPSPPDSPLASTRRGQRDSQVSANGGGGNDDEGADHSGPQGGEHLQRGRPSSASAAADIDGATVLVPYTADGRHSSGFNDSIISYDGSPQSPTSPMASAEGPTTFAVLRGRPQAQGYIGRASDLVFTCRQDTAAPWAGGAATIGTDTSGGEESANSTQRLYQPLSGSSGSGGPQAPGRDSMSQDSGRSGLAVSMSVPEGGAVHSTSAGSYSGGAPHSIVVNSHQNSASGFGPVPSSKLPTPRAREAILAPYASHSREELLEVILRLTLAAESSGSGGGGGATDRGLRTPRRGWGTASVASASGQGSAPPTTAVPPSVARGRRRSSVFLVVTSPNMSEGTAAGGASQNDEVGSPPAAHIRESSSASGRRGGHHNTTASDAASTNSFGTDAPLPLSAFRFGGGDSFDELSLRGGGGGGALSARPGSDTASVSRPPSCFMHSIRDNATPIGLSVRGRAALSARHSVVHRVINGYTITDRRLGAGAYGQVWLGMRVADGYPVAIKVIERRRVCKGWRRMLRRAGSNISVASGLYHPDASPSDTNSRCGALEPSFCTVGSPTTSIAPPLLLPTVSASEASPSLSGGVAATTGSSGGGGSGTFLLEHEIAVMKRLRHRNVVRLEEVIEDGGAFLLVMPYIANGPVLRLGRDGTCEPLDIDIVRGYMRQLLAAVAYLHRNGVVHCDIKPENVLLGDNGHVFLSDFGVSRIFEAPGRGVNRSGPGTMTVVDEGSGSASVSGFVTPCASFTMRSTKCTPAFAAPETLTGEAFSGAAADVWSVGVTMYAMLFGRLPFSGTMRDVFRAIETCEEVPFVVPPEPPATASVEHFDDDEGDGDGDGEVLEGQRALRAAVAAVGGDEAVAAAMTLRGYSPRHGLVRKYLEALRLLRAMLAISPEGRIVAAEALADPFLSSSRFATLHGLKQQQHVRTGGNSTVTTSTVPGPSRSVPRRGKHFRDPGEGTDSGASSRCGSPLCPGGLPTMGVTDSTGSTLTVAGEGTGSPRSPTAPSNGGGGGGADPSSSSSTMPCVPFAAFAQHPAQAAPTRHHVPNNARGDPPIPNPPATASETNGGAGGVGFTHSGLSDAASHASAGAGHGARRRRSLHSHITEAELLASIVPRDVRTDASTAARAQAFLELPL